MNARPPLFRPEAVPGGDAGAPLGTRPVSWRLVMLALAATAALVLGFSAFAGLSRKETLTGHLQPALGLVRVTAPRAGVVTAVQVQPGTWVEAGTPLFVIETPAEIEGGGSLAAVRGEAVSEQIAAARARLEAERQSAALDEAQARSRLEGLRTEARSLTEQRTVQVERIRAVEARLNAIAPLRTRGFISEDEFRNREEYLLSLRQGLSGLERQLAENRRQQGDAAIAVRHASISFGERSAAARAERAGLARGQAEAAAAGSQLVRAPVAGRVIGFRAERGQAVTAGAQIASLAPGTTGLRAVLFASPAAVGLIRRGQAVRLMYDAYPPARYGVQDGVVTNIGTAALPGDDMQGPARYRVEVALMRQTVAARGEERPLQPDMTVTADIVLEERSLLEWVMEPLMAARSRR